jgi:hypothetical protein
MSILSSAGRLVAAVTLAAGVSTGVATAAHADPATAVTGTYRITTPRTQTGVDARIIELSLEPADAVVTRRVDWGDGSPVEVTTTAPGAEWHHAYAEVGTYHVSIELVNGTDTTAGKFPDGDSVQVLAQAPPELLSGTYHLVPDHVRVGQTVKIDESGLHGDTTPPVYVFRYVNWGDGSKEDEWSGALPPSTHKYTKPGTYHVSIRLTNLEWHTTGTFPDGNTVVVTRAGSGNTGGSTGHGGGGTGGGGLPITGPGTALLGVVGLALIAGGAAAFVAVRRRTRFVG